MDEVLAHPPGGPQPPGGPGRTPREAPWGYRDMLWAVAAAIGLIVVGIIIVAVSIALSGRGTSSLAPQSVFVVFALEAVLLVPAWLWGPHKYGGGWARLGLHRGPVLRAIVLLVITFPLVLLVNGLWEIARQALNLPGQPNYLPLFGSGPGGLGIALLLGGVVAPVAEEVFFRGYLYAGLRTRLGLGWGLAISGAIFALAHGIPGVFPPIFLMGVMLALLYELTGLLWPSIALHAAINSLAFTAAYVASKYPSLFGQ